MSTPESALKKDVTDLLTKTGEFFLRINTGVIRKGSRYIHLAPEGTPDILVFRQPNHWIELKSGKTSKDRAEKQSAFREKVISLGHKHCVATSVVDVIEFLKGEMKEELKDSHTGTKLLNQQEYCIKMGVTRRIVRRYVGGVEYLQSLEPHIQRLLLRSKITDVTA